MTQSDATVATPHARTSRRTPTTVFRVGWWVLVVLTAVLAANHALGGSTYATSDDERALFVVFLAFNALSLVVLLIPYRRRERWSWWATWIPVLTNALPLVLYPIDKVVAFYAGVAVLMAAAQLTTLPAFDRRHTA